MVIAPEPVEVNHDQKIEIRRVPPLLEEERPENWKALELRYVQIEGSGREARARGAVFQTALDAC